MPFEKILVPCDFSASSRSALEYAGQLARAMDSELTLLHVVDLPPVLYGVDQSNAATLVEGRMTEHARGELATEREIIPDVKDSKISLRVRPGSPAREIVDEVQEAQLDTIIIGTHGRGAIRHALLGSVAETTVRLAPCPVITVHAEQRYEAPRRILFPTDLSPGSWKPLVEATSLARRFGAELTVLHVIEDASDAQVLDFSEFPFLDPDRNGEEMEGHAREALARQIEEQADLLSGIESSSLIRRGAPARQVVAAADALSIDMIVMSTHGRRGIRESIIGSVTDKVIRKATCPVLSVKPAG